MVHFLLVLAGVGVGALGSMLGIGGGIFMVPLLLLTGLVPASQLAVGTSIVGVVANGVSSTAAYLKRRVTNWRVGLAVIPGAMAGGWIGPWISERVASGTLALAFGIFLLYPAGVLLAGKQPKDLFRARPRAVPLTPTLSPMGRGGPVPVAPTRSPEGRGELVPVVPTLPSDGGGGSVPLTPTLSPEGRGGPVPVAPTLSPEGRGGLAPVAPSLSPGRRGMKGEGGSVSLLAGLGIGLLAGTAGGLFGIGGGVIMVPALTLLGLDIVPAVATSLFVMIPSAGTATVRHALAGHTRWDLALPLAAGVVVGAQIGPWLTTRVPAVWLRRLFSLVLLYTAVQMILTGLP